MIVKLFLFWRIGLLLVTYLGSTTIPLISNRGIGSWDLNKPFDFWKSWAQWDGGHYFSIAQSGYRSVSDYAFFPLYPFLVKMLSLLLANNILLSGLIISNFSFILFLLFFFKVIKEKFSDEIAFITTVTFLVFPTTFFAVAFYSESTFLLLVVITFLFLNKRKFLLASIIAGLASLTRFFGIFLVASIVFSYFTRISLNFKKIDSKVFKITPAFFGLAVYSLYLYIKSGDPIKFLTVQSFWQRFPQDPVSTIFGYIWSIVTGNSRHINDFFDLGLTLLFLVVLIWGIKKIPSSWWIFSLLVILIPASTGTLTSMPRYLLGSFGAFVIIGHVLCKHPTFKILTWAFFLFIQAVLATLFVSGYWIA